MSMQQALGVVGGIVGSFFGYPQLGFVVGSLIGAALTPKEKSEGPRLDDLKVTVSTYGVGIPVLYGTERMGGNVIWSTDKIEVAETEEQGKGGGAEYTSYKYYVHMAVALCETPRDGAEVSIVKIFKNGKLYSDNSPELTAASAIASVLGTTAPSKDQSPTGPILYQGGESQLPDPTMEAWEGGAGSVPAYRGIVYVLMPGVECPNGQIPQFSFVLSVGAGRTTEKSEIGRGATGQGANQVFSGISTKEGFVYYLNDDYNHSLPYTVAPQVGGPGYLTPMVPISTGDLILPTQPIPVQGTGDPSYLMLAYANLADQSAGTATIYRQGLFTGERSIIGNYQPDPGNTHFVFRWAAYDASDGTYILVPNFGESPTSIYFVGPTTGDIKPAAGYGAAAMHDGVVSFISIDGATLTRYDTATEVVTTHTVPIPTLGGTIHALIREDSGGVYILVLDSLGDGGIWKWSIDDGFVLLSDDVATLDVDSLPAGYEGYKNFFANDGMAILGPNHLDGAIYSYTLLRFNVVDPVPVIASEILVDQCERAGMSSSKFDVTDIPGTDTLHGYKIANPANARNNIQPILTAFGIGSREEDRKLKFFKLEDVTSIVEVPYVELGTTEDGQDPGDPFPLTRAQDADLASSVSVSYINPDFDYQTGTEKYRRQVTESQNDQTVDLVIATNSDHAMSVSMRICLNAYSERNKRSCKVPRKYSRYSAGDGVTIEYPEGTHGLYRLISVKDTGLSIEWECVPADSELFAITAVGATGYVGQEVTGLAPPTNMVLLDSPIMRDADNNAGLYVAAEGYGPGWRGYTLLVGDDDTDLQERGSVTTSATIGFAESALGNWSYNMLDGQNSVVLNIGDGELNSTTEALLMTSRVNLALIGNDGRWEAIQFMTASSLGSGRFLIYGLLRGLYGTERFRGTHEANDKFVLMTTAGMLRPNQDVGSLGQDKKYRPISIGRSRDSAPSQTFANTGIGLLPYSPWDPRKSKAASNDQTITWERRSRLSTNALRGIVPLGEATESYSIEFYTSSAFTTLAGTLTSTTKTLTITSAQQTAFGLTPGATLYVHIRQVSDVVGAGAPLEATL